MIFRQIIGLFRFTFNVHCVDMRLLCIPIISVTYGGCMISILKAVLGAGCGLAGVGAVFFYGLMSEAITMPALSNLTPDLVYKSFIATLGTCLIMLVILVYTHLASKNKSGDTVSSTGSGHAVKTTGNNSSVTIGRKD